MALFVTSTSNVARHGVFAISRTPPSAIQASATGIAGMVGAFPWGPSQTLQRPASRAEFIKMFAPPGTTHTGSAYLMFLATAFPSLYAVRAVSSTAVAATCPIPVSTPNITINAKYPGTEANAFTATVSVPDDGNANHFNLTVTCTSASGTTTEVLKSLNFSGTGADTVVDFTNSTLMASFTRGAGAGRPAVATYTFSGGTTPALVTSDYTGTIGSGDKGVAQFENDKTVRHVFCDDPGNTNRTAINNGMLAHANLLLDRVAYIAGPSGQTAAAAQTDVATYTATINGVYTDPWAYIFDDVTGAQQLIPGNVFAASLAANLSPSTSIAWKDPSARKYFGSIAKLEADRGDAAGVNTNTGICTIINFPGGGYAFEAGKNTVFPSTPSQGNLTRTNMGIYIASSVVNSLGSNVDAPNVPINQQDVVNAVDDFLAGLKHNKDVNPNGAPYILDYQILNIQASNLQTDLDAGNFTIPANIKIGSSMERIFLSVQYGETVKITAT